MATVCTATAHRYVRGGALSFFDDPNASQSSWGYILIACDVVDGHLTNARTVGGGCGFTDRAEAIRYGNAAAQRIEAQKRLTEDEKLAGDKLRMAFGARYRDEQALRDQVHYFNCMGVL